MHTMWRHLLVHTQSKKKLLFSLNSIPMLRFPCSAEQSVKIFLKQSQVTHKTLFLQLSWGIFTGCNFDTS